MSRKKINLSNHSGSFYSKAIELTIIALTVLVPIAFYPRCIDAFNPAKEFVAEVLILLGLMFWVLKIIDREEIQFTSTPLNLPILSFVSMCVLSLLWSDTFFTSLKELPLFLAGPLLYFVIVNNTRGEKQINRIISAVIIVGAVFGIFGIFQYNGIDFPFWTHPSGRHQIFGVFGNVNYFAEYLIVPLSLAVSIFFTTKDRNRKILLLIGILTMGTTLILTLTRGSYLGFGIAIISMFFLFLLSKGKRFIEENKKIFIVLLTAIIIVSFLFIIPTPLSKPGTTISQIKGRISITQLTTEFFSGGRVAIWKFTEMMIKDRPILGSGIGTFKYNTLRYQAKFFEQGDNRSIYPHDFSDKVHNEYLQLWAELGAIGLAIFLWLIIAYFNQGIRYLKREKDTQKQGMMIGLMGAVVAVLVDGIFGFPLHLPATIVLFWLVIGLAVVVGLKDEVNAKKNIISRFKPFLYIGIIFLTIFLCVTMMRPFMARIFYYSGLKEAKKGNWEKATDIYEEALKWNPYEGELHYVLGRVFLMRGLGNTALKSFKEAEKYIDGPDLPESVAIVYLAKGNLDEAIDSLKKAISYQSREETMAPLYIDLGNTYLKLEKYELAEAAFKNAVDKLERAISYQPTERTMAPLYFDLGNAYLKLEKYELTEIAFKNAIRINSNLLTDDSLKQNRTDEELVELKNKITSNLANAHYGLAGAYIKQNKTEEGLAELKKVIELAPDSQEAKYAREAIQKTEQTKPEPQPTN